jgi:hypothetical protein
MRLPGSKRGYHGGAAPHGRLSIRIRAMAEERCKSHAGDWDWGAKERGGVATIHGVALFDVPITYRRYFPRHRGECAPLCSGQAEVDN